MSASHFFLVLVLVALASAQHLFPSSVAFVNAPAQVALTSPAFQLTLNGTVQYVPGADGYDDRVHLSAVYQGSQIDIYANASFSAAQVRPVYAPFAPALLRSLCHRSFILVYLTSRSSIL